MAVAIAPAMAAALASAMTAIAPAMIATIAAAIARLPLRFLPSDSVDVVQAILLTVPPSTSSPFEFPFHVLDGFFTERGFAKPREAYSRRPAYGNGDSCLVLYHSKIFDAVLAHPVAFADLQFLDCKFIQILSDTSAGS